MAEDNVIYRNIGGLVEQWLKDIGALGLEHQHCDGSRMCFCSPNDGFMQCPGMPNLEARDCEPVYAIKLEEGAICKNCLCYGCDNSGEKCPNNNCWPSKPNNGTDEKDCGPLNFCSDHCGSRQGKG